MDSEKQAPVNRGHISPRTRSCFGHCREVIADGEPRVIAIGETPCKRPPKGPFNTHTASFAALTGRALTIFRAGLALNVIASPVNGLVPCRALVAARYSAHQVIARHGERSAPRFGGMIPARQEQCAETYCGKPHAIAQPVCGERD